MGLSRPTSAKGIVTRTVGNETVLVPLRTNVASLDSIYLLSQVGAFLWQHLDGTRDREALCRLVTERFRVPEGRDVAADLDTFLGELARRGLVVEAST
jgi:hypothetical protein